MSEELLVLLGLLEELELLEVPGAGTAADELLGVSITCKTRI